jgi:hypothetical protein
MYNISKLRRSVEGDDIHPPTDIWTEEDELLFCKYCTSKREKALLRVARDTGFRVSDLVKIKIKDLVIKQMENGSRTAEITIITTKTGRKATGRIYYSYSYLKEWLANGHPFPNVPDAPIFCGTGKKNTGRRIQPHTIWKIFDHYKKVVFPKMLEDRTIEPEDVQKVKDLLKKPWNPHWRRHIAATEIGDKVKDPVKASKLLGLNPMGNTIKRYMHYSDADAIEALNAADGLVPVNSPNRKNKDLLKPKICPDCGENNRPDARICSKCKYALSRDHWIDNEQEQTKKDLEELKARQNEEIAKLKDEQERMKETMYAVIYRFMHGSEPASSKQKQQA